MIRSSVLMRSTTLALLLAGHPLIQLHHCDGSRSVTGAACFDQLVKPNMAG
jgi:hypothetical protein